MAGARRGENYKAPELLCARCARVIPRGARNLRWAPVLCLRCVKLPGVTFGQRLRAFRMAAGMTQVALARRIGVSGKCIWLAERDRHAVRARIVEKLL